MGRRHSWRLVVAVATALTAGLLITANPALALDGPPVVESINPQWAPTAGGVPVRIYGTGLTGVTSVKFGAVNATKFKVIDSFLITAVVPAAATGTAANNTFVDVTVADSEGTNTMVGALYYSNATLTVSPNTGLVAGNAITVALSGYQPNASMVLPQVNPLLLYVERSPDFPPGPPPYAQVLETPATDASGAYSVNTNLANPFVGFNGAAYDSNIACPVNQTTANFLGNSNPTSFTKPVYSARCLIATGQFGSGTLDTPISFTTDPAPAAPVLNLNLTSAAQGQKVTIAAGSNNWNANPFYGSSKSGSLPGQTKTEVRICGIGGNPASCSSTVGSGTVSMTRYINRVFSGATLTGSITVGSDVPDGCACFVRVRQNRPGGGVIEATRTLTIT